MSSDVRRHWCVGDLEFWCPLSTCTLYIFRFLLCRFWPAAYGISLIVHRAACSSAIQSSFSLTAELSYATQDAEVLCSYYVLWPKRMKLFVEVNVPYATIFQRPFNLHNRFHHLLRHDSFFSIGFVVCLHNHLNLATTMLCVFVTLRSR